MSNPAPDYRSAYDTAREILEAYGGKIPAIPDGWELDGTFGPVYGHPSEYVLGEFGGACRVTNYGQCDTWKRLGLREKPRILIGFKLMILNRPPKPGELYIRESDMDIADTNFHNVVTKRLPNFNNDNYYACSVAIRWEPIFSE